MLFVLFLLCVMCNNHKSFTCSVTEKSGKFQIVLLKLLQFQLPAVITKSMFSAKGSSAEERGKIYTAGNRILQQSRLGGRTSSSQCGKHCCHSMIPSEGTLLFPTQTAVHKNWSAHIRPSCRQHADGHKDSQMRSNQNMEST